MLPRKDQVPDKQITERVAHLISSRGLRSPCKVSINTSNGQVVLSGTVQHAHQKTAAVQVARGVNGVRRVVDNLVVTPMKKY
jgi:osmotically-inducible protein OsmY